MDQEIKYRYTHCHEGMTMAPEFWAKGNKDAIAYVKMIKGDSRDEPFKPCFCQGERLERESGPQERAGNVIEISTSWAEVRLV